MNVFEIYQAERIQKANASMHPEIQHVSKKTMKGVSRQAKFLLDNPDMLPFAHFQKSGITIRDWDMLTKYFSHIFSVHEGKYYIKKENLGAFNTAQKSYLSNPQKFDRPMTGYLTPGV